MIAINVTASETDKLPGWRAEGGYTFPIALGDKQFAEAHYSVTACPTNLLLDSARKAIFRHVGYRTGGEKALEAEIRDLLGLEPFEATESRQ